MKRVLLLAAAALALSAPLAFAQPSAPQTAVAAAAATDGAGRAGRAGGGHGKAEFLSTYDINGDSVVARTEFDARRTEQYQRADANHDGVVTEAEYIAEYQVRLDAELAAQREAQLRQAHVRFGVLDTDHNAGMTSTEFGASGQRMFARLDTNGDGVVDERDTAESF